MRAADDSDLEDLIASPVGTSKTNNVAAKSGPYAPSPGGGEGGFLSMTPCGFVWGACRLCMYKFPRLSKCALLFLFLGFISLIFNPTQIIGIFGDDYSAINSAFEFSLSKVDHWCLQGDNDSCKCENPLEPTSRSELKAWNVAHKANVADVDLYRAVYGKEPSLIDEATGKPRPPIDVAFLGESVVEAMDGRWLGKRVARAINKKNGKEGEEAKNKPDIGKVFDRLFRKDNGGPVEGVALGVAGDTTANVLWRLQHDEMPYDFNPKVWWLVLGMNDLTRMQCSEEIVVLGILRVVEEIRLRKPDAKIVINSLLPMIRFQKGDAPKMADFADFKRAKAGKTREVNDIIKATERGENVDDKPRHMRKLRRKKNKEKSGDEEAVEGDDLEEALEHQEMVFEKSDKRFHDQVFADMEKYHPKAAVSKLIPMIKKKVMPPVWPSVHLINDKLKEFCQKHEDISFFDATTIFADDLGHGRHRLRENLISPRGHPSELGFAVWENRIMGKLNKLIIEKDREIAEAQAQDAEEEDEMEDSEEEDISLEGSADEDDGDGEEQDGGDGEDNLSEGKENEPPKQDTQPSRDDPPSEEKEGDDDGKEETSKKENEDKEVADRSGEEKKAELKTNEIKDTKREGNGKDDDSEGEDGDGGNGADDGEEEEEEG